MSVALKDIRGFSISGLSKINVLLGKNGCGKSHFLKEVEQEIAKRPEFGKVRYLSPERGGILEYQPGIDQNIGNNPNWLPDTRRRNQAGDFRQQSAVLFRRLELLSLRTLEVDKTAESFYGTVHQLNTLLDRIWIERDEEKAFKIYDKRNASLTTADRLSSGESELISLGIEFLAFVKECKLDKRNVLFVDEPDVHLHPDLQHRLATFICEVVRQAPMMVILATHSTSLLAGLAEHERVQVAFMRRGDTDLTFKSITDVDRKILPIFGAHPLSNVFNKTPIMLIEGEDDERIWQQAIRSSQGKIRIHPCVIEGNAQFLKFENEINEILASVYDEARAYSLRYRDLNAERIENLGYVIRMRLSCRTAENLMLSDDVLRLAGISWDEFRGRLEQWVADRPTHPRYESVKSFIDGGCDRKNSDLKDIRNILIGEISAKPWEVLVGQAIADLSIRGGGGGENSLINYLGQKVCSHIVGLA